MELLGQFPFCAVERILSIFDVSRHQSESLARIVRRGLLDESDLISVELREHGYPVPLIHPLEPERGVYLFRGQLEIFPWNSTFFHTDILLLKVPFVYGVNYNSKICFCQIAENMIHLQKIIFPLSFCYHNTMANLRILVTGGTGFIGSNIALELIARGHEVLITGNDAEQKLPGFKGKYLQPGFRGLIGKRSGD